MVHLPFLSSNHIAYNSFYLTAYNYFYLTVYNYFYLQSKLDFTYFFVSGEKYVKSGCT